MSEATYEPASFSDFAGQSGLGRISPDVQMQREKVRLALLENEQRYSPDDPNLTKELSIQREKIASGDPFNRGVKISSELKKSKPTYEPMTFGDEPAPSGATYEPMFPEAKPAAAAPKPKSEVMDTVRELGRSIWEGITVHTPASIAAAYQGMDISDEGISGFLIDRSKAVQQQRAAEAGVDRPSAIPGISIKDVRDLGQNLGFSLTSMGAGLAAGIPAGLVGSIGTPVAGTLAGYGAGVGAAGKVAYNMDVNQVTRQLKEAADEESQKVNGRPQTPEEWQAKLEAMKGEIQKHGLYEAIPEALGSGAGFAILTTAAKIFGKGVIARFSSKLGALYGEEMLTETVTQIGQQAAETRMGLHPGDKERSFASADDWLESAKEVAPQVFLLTTLMGGGVKAGQMAYQAGKGAPQAPTTPAGEPTTPPEAVEPAVAPPEQPAEPPKALGYQAGEPLVVFPDGSTMTRAQYEQERADGITHAAPVNLPQEPLSPIDQARSDAQILKSGQNLPEADETRLKNATLLSVYGENAAVRHVIEQPDQFGSIAEAMLAVAPTVERVRGAIGGSQEQLDITPDILGAIDELAQGVTRGQTLSQAMAQAVAHDISYEGQQLMAFLDENSGNPQKIATFLENYLHEVERLGGTQSQVRGRAFDIIQERQAAKKAEAEKLTKEAKGKAFAKTEKAAKSERVVTTKKATEQHAAEKVLTSIAVAKAAGSGVNPEHITAIELAFRNAKKLKGKPNAKPSAESGGAVPSGTPSAPKAGGGQGEPVTGRREKPVSEPDKAAGQVNAQPVRKEGDQRRAAEKPVNRGAAISAELKGELEAYTHKQAKRLAKLGDVKQMVIRHPTKPGMWAIVEAPKRDRSAKQRANDARLARARNSIDTRRDSLFTAIGKLGGMDRDAVKAEWGIDPKDSLQSGVIGKPVLRARGGASVDGMAELLGQYGYLPKDENGKIDLADFEELFGQELRGEKVLAAEGVEAQAERRKAQQEAEFLAAEVEAAGIDPSAENVGDVDLMALANEIDPDAVERLAISYDGRPDAEFMKAIQEFIDEHNRRNEAQDRAGEKAGGAEQAPAAEQRKAAYNADQQGFELAPKPAERFEVGKSLNADERKKVLATLVDVYKAKGADKEVKGQDRDGNDIIGYVYSPDLFEKSAITGSMVRYHVTLPDGRLAHPTELFPDYTQSKIDAALAEQRYKEKVAEDDQKHRAEVLGRRRTDSIDGANKLYWQSQRGADIKPEDTVLLTNGIDYIRTHKSFEQGDLSILGDSWYRYGTTPLKLTGQTAAEIAEAEKSAREAKAKEAATAKAAADVEKAAKERAAIKEASTKSDFALTSTEPVAAKDQRAIDAKAAADQLAGQDSLFQRRQIYNPDQAELIYENAPLRPSTTPEQKRLGILALNALFGPKRVAGGPEARQGDVDRGVSTLLGSALWRDFQERAGAELIGQQAGSASDLALAAQILRDPRFETLRIFFVKDGKIVGHTGWTSRLPGSVSFSIETSARSKQVNAGETGVGYNLRRALLKHEMENLGADGYYMLHNHPSGSAQPSRADEELTTKLAKEMPGFLGHVVIDHNEYASISRFGSSSVIKSERLAAQKPVPELAHDALGMHIESPSGIVAVGKMLQVQKGYATLVATNAQGNVQAIAEVPEAMLTESKDPMARGRALVRIRKFMNQTGSAGGAFIVAENPERFDWLIKKGSLTDAVGTDGKTRSQAGILQPHYIVGRAKQMVLAARQMAWQGDQTQTAEFKAWFADSKVVDAEGKPLRVYHGTGTDIGGVFKDSSAAEYYEGLSQFFFTSDTTAANGYAADREKKRWVLDFAKDDLGDGEMFEGPFDTKKEALEYKKNEFPSGVLREVGGSANVVPVYLSFQKPFVVDAKGKNWSHLGTLPEIKALDWGSYLTPAFIHGWAVKHGYDSVIIKQVDDNVKENIGRPHDVYIASRPEQIKSAIGNRGTFDPNSPSIVEQPRAPYNINEVRQTGYRNTARRAIDRIDQALNPLGQLPDQHKFLAQRGLAQGLIEKADEAAGEIRNAFPKASDADKQAIFDYLTTAGATSNGIKDATARTNAEKIKAQIGKIGDELVAHGMLSRETVEQYKDAYLPRLYLKHLLNEQDWRALGSGKKPSDMGYLKKRKNIPEDVRRVLLGEVTDPGFLAAVAIAKPARDMALLDWLTQISKNQNWILPESLVQFTSTVTGKTIRATPFWLKEDAARLRKQARYYTPENAAKAETEAKAMDEVADEALENIQGEHREFKQIPNTPRYGYLRGMFVRQEIYDDLMGINDFLPTDPGWFQNVFGYGGVGTKVTQIWKGMKVAMNPPAQVRNFISNAILMQLGGVPLRLVPARIFQAINEISTDGPHYQVGKKYGIAVSTFATQEVYRMKTELLDLEMKTRGMGALGRLHRIAALIFNKSSDFYQLSETIFKTGMIIDGMRRQKMSEEDAVQLAQKWLFDYSLIQKSARYARSAPIGIPFLTFSLKVLPRLLEVAALHPQRLIPWAALFYGFPMMVANMLDVDDDDLDKLKKALPEWLQDKGHALILPFKDEQGRWQIIDLGYFMPWTTWTELGKNIVSGEAGKAVKTAGIFSGPITDIVVAIKTGKDPFTGRDIWNKGDPPERQLVSLMNYVWNLAAPPFLTDHGLVSPMGLLDKAYGGKMVQALTGTTNKFGEPRSSAGQAALYLMGINVQAITPEYTRAQNLQRMAREMQDVKIQMVQKLQDRSLTPDRTKEIASEYAAEIVKRAEKIQKYAKESEIHPRLATQ